MLQSQTLSSQLRPVDNFRTGIIITFHLTVEMSPYRFCSSSGRRPGIYSKARRWEAVRKLSCITLCSEFFFFFFFLRGNISCYKFCSIQILSDNVTTVAYVSNQGGPSKDLTQIAKAIWHLVASNNIALQIRHISGTNNVDADHLSRLQDKYNWMLHPKLFHLIDTLYGPHTIDRFVSATNSQLPRFNSRYHEAHAEGVDALAQGNLDTERNFVNPPFRLIPHVLRVIQAQRAEATIIAPFWLSQPWFRMLRQLLVCPPLRIPNSPQTFRSMRPRPEPLQNRRWRIYAWRMSGAHGWQPDNIDRQTHWPQYRICIMPWVELTWAHWITLAGFTRLSWNLPQLSPGATL